VFAHVDVAGFDPDGVVNDAVHDRVGGDSAAEHASDAAGARADFDAYLADVVNTNRRRIRCLQEFRRAGLATSP